MERQQNNLLQNFDGHKSDILKKRLLKSSGISAAAGAGAHPAHALRHQNVRMSNTRTPLSSSMIVTSVQPPQNSMNITHNLLTHSIAPVKIHSNNSYPLHLSTVHVPVQLPGSNSNINVPVQISGPASIPIQLTNPTVSLPLQVSTNQLVTSSIGVPLQIPQGNPNIHLPTLPSMPLLHDPSQSLHSSIIHVHMGSNPRAGNMDNKQDMSLLNSQQIHMSDGMQVISNPSSVPNTTVVQIPNSSSNSIQLTLPSNNAGNVQLRGSSRPIPHMVYIQTPQGLKPVASSDVMSQASTSGNPPQIIVRRPITNAANIHLISNLGHKPNIAPKIAAGKSLLNNAGQPIVIQKPKTSDKMIVPVSISAKVPGKSGISYLGSVKKNPTKLPESQSILIQNNQNVPANSNQKLFITPMNMPKIQNPKYILPVTLPATMASKGPIINLQIANGQIQNDPQGNITVMRDTGSSESLPPLQPLIKTVNGKEVQIPASVPQSPKSDKSFAISIAGSRAEPTGEQEYSLSIPETNASMNDDIYTVSIADEDGGQQEKSFTLAIPEKGRSLLNKNVFERHEMAPVPIPAPAILRRSNSDNTERKTNSANLKRRISLCNEGVPNKQFKSNFSQKKPQGNQHSVDNSDDHRVPSLFCDEKLDKDLESKVNLGDSEPEDYKEEKSDPNMRRKSVDLRYGHIEVQKERVKRESTESKPEDPSGLVWSNGVALLQGSNLQFQTNEFGLIDLIDSSDQEDAVTNHKSKYQTPLKQRIGGSGQKKPTSPEDLYRCDGCGCHGMAAEFITPNFCSLTCQNEVKKAVAKKQDKERVELMKKRNRMKKLLLQKQLSESDLNSENEKAAQRSNDNSTPPDMRLEGKEEEVVQNEKYPWMCGKNGFSWMRYLEHCKSKAAPVKLFKDPFPYARNGFKVGMRLEAIDPQHPSLFCVASVAEVQGYRLRIHFDEYQDIFDFWVNADSPDIFPAGWCEKNGRTLTPPSGHASDFAWPLYLKEIRAVAASKQLFLHLGNHTVKPNGFRTGMKLEAEDRKNNLVCVASVADMMDNRLLINFDSWDEMYDFWADPTSPYIHPVGWAEENGIALTPPNYYKDPESFSWETYLAESGAAAAPARAFKTRPPQGFKLGMKLEVVDKRVPFLIRVATIASVKAHQVLVSFDGWADEYAVWLDDDSPDVHPVGWCLKTGHPLEPPLTVEEVRVCGPCGVGGCRGLGSLLGGARKTHGAASACPYRPRRPPPAPPRLQPPPAARAEPRHKNFGRTPKPVHSSTPTSETGRGKYVVPRGRPPKHRRLDEIKTDPASEDESVSSSGGKRWRPARPSSRDVEAGGVRRYRARGGGGGGGGAPWEGGAAALAPALEEHMRHLALPDQPATWTQEEVSALVARLAGGAAGAAAAAARLSGRELLMASREELVNCAHLRLGPAIKVYAAAQRLRAAAES